MSRRFIPTALTTSLLLAAIATATLGTVMSPASATPPSSLRTLAMPAYVSHPTAPLHATTTTIKSVVKKSKKRAPTITLNPRSATVAVGGSVILSAAAIANPSPRVQWQVSLASSLWSSIPGAKSATYQIKPVQPVMNHSRYRAVFTNSVGHATSTAATLTVGGSSGFSPVVVSQPQSTTVYNGAIVTLSAEASGNPLPSIQWQSAPPASNMFTVVPHATSLLYSFVASSSLNGSRYRAIFSNSAGQVLSSSATLTVLTPTPVTTTSFPTTSTTLPFTTTTFPTTSTTLPFTTTTFPTTTTTIPSSTTTTTPPSGPTPTPSSNWSGYSTSSDVFSTVSATWVVPTASCGPFDTYSAIWIGIDGATSPTVEQDGTEADCSNGVPTYNAWYEMYGDTSVTCGCYSEVPLSTTQYPVQPGDTMRATISYVAGEWTLALNDPTQAWSFSINIADPLPSPARSSAEWIVERPTICLDSSCTFTALSNLTPQGTVLFTNAHTSGATMSGAISSFAFTAIDMVNGFTVIDQPSGLHASGTSFSVAPPS